MSFLRPLLRIGESNTRAAETQLRRFWQQESHVPVYARRKFDGLWFGISVTLLGAAVVNGAFQIKDMIKGK
ncbi:hypothetical protein HDU97_003487 [Phlyctochytrium planicorne]|nr:hypothetical protein HDU97_003487 [Phlyctochytrium planicorne]